LPSGLGVSEAFYVAEPPIPAGAFPFTSFSLISLLWLKRKILRKNDL